MVLKKTNSGVSIAMNAILTSLEQNKPLIEKKNPPEFTVKIANTLQEREAVFRLGYQIYLEKEYIKSNPEEWLVQNYDSEPTTTILMVEDQEKNLVGSVTLVFDGHCKLPAERIYCGELNILRNQNEKIVEISRLVINPQFRNSKEVLVLLFNYLYIYSYYVKNYTCLAIEVNPRHTAYYESLLNFRAIGNERPCPSVQSAPAILMYVSLKHGQSEVLRFSENVEFEKKTRSLYPYFVAPKQERLVAYYLEHQAKPITEEEKQYFGFIKSNNRLAAAL
jgi:hypothetical protein